MTCPLPRAEISFYPLRFVKAKIIKRQYVFKFDENKDNLQQKKTVLNWKKYGTLFIFFDALCH